MFLLSNRDASNFYILFSTSSISTRMGTSIDGVEVEFQHKEDFCVQASFMPQIIRIEAGNVRGMNECIILRTKHLSASLSEC